MKTFIIGQRTGGERGIFIAPPGVDADTATPDQLLLHISNKIDQVILRGRTTASGSVPLGLTTYAPSAVLFPAASAWFRFYNSDGSSFTTSGYGVTRPMPNYWDGASWSASMSAAAMSVSMSGLNALGYMIFTRAAP